MTGQRFGRLVVLNYAGPDQRGRSRPAMWKCQCDCGKVIVTRGRNLRCGKTKSCGCLNRNNLTGQCFGKLTVIGPVKYKRDKKHQGYHWKCRCVCGKVVIVAADALKRAAPNKSCGCAAKKRKPKFSLLGKRFGYLLVLEEGRMNGRARCKCQCKCGSFTTPTRTSLIEGKTRSCGCFRRIRSRLHRRIPMMGRRFGRLVVMQEHHQRRGVRILWACQCDCGRTSIHGGADLRKGLVVSCGCYKIEQARHNLENGVGIKTLEVNLSSSVIRRLQRAEAELTQNASEKTG